MILDMQERNVASLRENTRSEYVMPTNILVVDDNQTYRDAFCSMLQISFPNVQIVTTSDGISALGLTYKITFDLIVLDYELTTMSGSDIVRRLRARGRPLPPLVLMSAHPDVAVFARLNKFNAYLQKPVAINELQRVIEPLLALHGTNTAFTTSAAEVCSNAATPAESGISVTSVDQREGFSAKISTTAR